MNANEFRRGNLVQWMYADEYEKIDAIFEDEVRLECGSICDIEDDIKPIPLTEEWFRNFYLDREENGYYYITESVVISIDNYVYCGRTFLTELNYVHQLQNLYFALTGTELTIK